MESLSPTSSCELLTDEQLVSRAKAGAREAFNQLVLRHERRLFRFLCKNSPNSADVEDAMQQAMLKAYTKLAQYDPRWRFTTWLFTIALRELRTLARRSGPLTLSLDPAHEPPASHSVAPDPDPHADGLWFTARRLLKPQHYTALWLRYGEDLPARDIAKVLNRPRIWVRVTLHRACTLLRQTIARETMPKSASPSPKACSQSKQAAGGAI